jgi:hypothetical protein
VRRDLVSPIGLAATALLVALAAGVAHALGLRADATFLSGTAPPDAGGATLGLIYVVLYFAALVAAPVLLIGAAVMTLLQRLDLRIGRRRADD